MRTVAATCAAAAMLAVCAASAGSASAAECAPPLPGPSVTFEYQGESQRFVVPEGVSTLSVTARGGHGGEYADTAKGGLGGVVTTTLPVTARECLDVYVGGYGVDPNGGFGHGNGGGKGSVPIGWDGHPSAAGGGATALTRGSTPLVVAGGGGGGGGNGWNVIDVAWAGAGGDAGGGTGTPKGADGGQPNPAPGEQAPLGGPGGGSERKDGEQGDSTGQQIWDPFLGAGGAGGGGYPHGGGAGGVAVAKCEHTSCFSLPVGGGGGGGGDSYAAPNAQDPSYSVYDDETCPADGGAEACYGQLTLDWTVSAGSVSTYGGSGQGVVIGSPFPQPLQARVTAADGNPLVGFDVTFTLPDSGPSARFDEGDSTPTSVTARTDANGVATTPPLIAGTEAGNWTATATASGAPSPARFALSNNPAPTATAVTSSANPSVSGEPVSFSAQVRSAPTTAPPPDGHVRFSVDDAPIGTVALDEFGRATSDPVSLRRGEEQIDAVFIPSPDFEPSAGQLTQRTDPTRSVVALSSSENPSSSGAGVTFTADVSAVAPGSGTPTGTVRFEVDNDPLGEPVELTAGNATSQAVDLDDGEHVVRASYLGDAEHEPSAATFAQAVGADATATELSASPASGVVGQPITLTATVKAADPSQTPTGSVTFEPDAAAPCQDVALDGAGQATCVVDGPLTPGDHEVLAVYSGDSGFEPSTGHWTQPVLAARTSVALQADPDPSVYGQEMRLHAGVAAVAPGAGTPSGIVRFLVDGVAVGPPVVLRDGRGSSPALSSPRAGPHVVEVEYSGDSGFLPAGSAVTQVVDRVETLGTVSSSAPRAPFGAPVSLRMHVDVVPPGKGPAEGAVQFRVDGVNHGAPVPVRDGVAVSAPLAGLGPGRHDVRASFAGSTDYAPSEATLVQDVDAPPGGPGGGGHTPGRGGHTPGGSRRSPAATWCDQVLAITHVQPSGRRIHLRGVARSRLAGRRLAITNRGRVVARTRVRRDGTFRASSRRPAARRWRATRYRARVGRRRSAAEPLTRHVRVRGFRAGGQQAVRIVAKLRGGKRQRLLLLRRRGCSTRMQRVRSVRTNRAGRVQVALPRPPAGVAVYRLRLAGRRAASLPIVIAPASRRSSE